MKFILATIGTEGDVNPFAAVGRALQARGHHVTLVTGGSFAGVAVREGFDFVELFTQEEYESILQDPDFWHPFRSVQLFMEKSLLPCMCKLYHIIAERADNDTIVVAIDHALGAARCAGASRRPVGDTRHWAVRVSDGRSKAPCIRY